MPVAVLAVPSAPGANGGLIVLKAVIGAIAPPLAAGLNARIASSAPIARVPTPTVPAIARARSAVLMDLVRLRATDPVQSAPVSIVLALIVPGAMLLAAVVAAASVVLVVSKALGGLASAPVPVLAPRSRIGGLIAGLSAATAIRHPRAVR